MAKKKKDRMLIESVLLSAEVGDVVTHVELNRLTGGDVTGKLRMTLHRAMKSLEEASTPVYFKERRSVGVERVDELPMASCVMCGVAVTVKTARISTTQCANCTRKQNVERATSWNKANPDTVSERKKQRHANMTPQEKDHRNHLPRIYYSKNPEKIREYHAQYAKDNPAKMKEINAKYKRVRRQRKKDATVGVVDFDLIRERDGDICYLCGSKVRDDVGSRHPEKRSMDHMIPISRGGDHSMANIRTACSKCNLKKGRRTYDEYMEDERVYS